MTKKIKDLTLADMPKCWDKLYEINPALMCLLQRMKNGLTLQKAQQFNGRYAVVYMDKLKFSRPLIDVCWGEQHRMFNLENAEARLKELRGEK